MKINDIIKSIQNEYGLSRKVKIRNLNLESKTFDIMLGDCLITLPLPKDIKRFLIIEELRI